MANISVDPLKENSLMYIYAIRDEIDMEPNYQRASDIWPLSKKQLLIDSLLNGLDMPKIYFHEISYKGKDGANKRYAVVDGKQRLGSIFDFFDGVFKVSDEFKDISGVFGDFAGKGYKDFGKISLKLKTRFEALPLPIHLIKTKDIDLIEEMFSRLNEAAPLSAPEKRNAFGGPLPLAIRNLQESIFFQKKVPFDNKRYRHYDIIAKLLLIEEQNKVTDTKKIHLDKFVKRYKNSSVDSINGITNQCASVTEFMSGVFKDKDELLRQITIIPVYYWVSRILISRSKESSFTREMLTYFDSERQSNRVLAQTEEDNEAVNYEWLEFDRLAQTPNDSSSIEFRINVLLKFMGESAIC